MLKHKVMVVESNPASLKKITDFLNASKSHIVAGATMNGEDALGRLTELAPDIIILELRAPSTDSFSVLRRIIKGNTKIIVLSTLTSAHVQATAMALGADCFLTKPVSLQSLQGCLDSVAALKNAQDCRCEDIAAVCPTVVGEVSKMCIVLGIPANIKGYGFLREAVVQAVAHPHIIHNVSRRLYPAVAAKFATTSSIVEASIRHAIEVAWNRGASERLNAIFGVCVYRQNEKPTNSELIALIADKILLDRAV